MQTYRVLGLGSCLLALGLGLDSGHNPDSDSSSLPSITTDSKSLTKHDPQIKNDKIFYRI